MSRRLLASLVLVLTLLGFGALALVALTAVSASSVPAFDRAVLEALHRLASPGVDALMIALSFLGTFGFLLVACTLATGFFAVARGRRAALFFATAPLGAWGLVLALKPWAQRPRPTLWTSVQPEPDFSFPSGHATVTMAIAVALVILARPRQRWRVAAVTGLLVLGVGVSRLYLGVHFPTDVVAGWCAGVAWVTLEAVLFFGVVSEP